MVDIYESFDPAVSRLNLTTGSLGSSGTGDSTLPTSPHYSDYESSYIASSQNSGTSNSSVDSLLDESLGFLENARCGKSGVDNTVANLSKFTETLSDDFFIPGLHKKLINDSPFRMNLDFEKTRIIPDSWDLAKSDGTLDYEFSRSTSDVNSKQSTPRSLGTTPRSSGMPSPRIAKMLRDLARDADRVCSPDATTLYQTRSQHYNPAGYGQHAYDECLEYTRWANSYLKYSPYETAITDLPRDLADGITLLHLVEVLLGMSIEPIHIRPALEVQRTENIQECLELLSMNGVNVDAVSTEDIVKGNVKVVLAFCKILSGHFGSCSGSPVLVKQFSPRHSSTARQHQLALLNKLNQSDRRASPPSRRSTPSPFAVLDGEDLALLNWVSNVTRIKATDYESFQDGHVLCVLVNKLLGGDAVPNVVIDHGLPSEKISLAIQVARDELHIETSVTTDEIRKNLNTEALATLLKHLHLVFIEKLAKEKETGAHTSVEMQMKPKELEYWDEELIKRFQQKQKRLITPVSKLSSDIKSRASSRGQIRETSKKHISLDSLDNTHVVEHRETKTQGSPAVGSFSDYFDSREKRFGHQRSPSPFKDDLYSQLHLNLCPSDIITFERSEDEKRKKFASSLNDASIYFGDKDINGNIFPLEERSRLSPRSMFTNGHTDNNQFVSLKGLNDFTQDRTLYSGYLHRDLHTKSETQTLLPSYNPRQEFDANVSLKSLSSKLGGGAVPVPTFDISTTKESIFDVEPLRTPFPVTSNKLECEDAKVKLSEYSRQLELLKRHYLGLVAEEMNVEQETRRITDDLKSRVTQDLELTMTSLGKDISNTPLEEQPSTTSREEKQTKARSRETRGTLLNPTEYPRTKRHQKSHSTNSVPSHLLLKYSNMNKGTFPPYRTWSLFVSDEVKSRQKQLGAFNFAEGRASLLEEKKSSSKDDVQILSLENEPLPSFEVDNPGERLEGMPNEDYMFNAPVIKDEKFKEVSTRDPIYDSYMEYRRLPERPKTAPPLEVKNSQRDEMASPRNTSGNESSVRHNSKESNPGKGLHGLTAMIRLTAKRANAVSDTE